jgi:hypothetical protein
VVHGVHEHGARTAVERRQRRPLDQVDLVEVAVVELLAAVDPHVGVAVARRRLLGEAAGDLVGLGGDVLVEGAAEGDVEDLGAPADAEHRLGRGVEGPHQLELVAVPDLVALPLRPERFLAVAAGADVGAPVARGRAGSCP